MSYEMLRLAQLVFALSLMFGAFLGGIAVGWWRWGRSSTRAKMSQLPAADAPPHPTGLFTPAGLSDEEIVLQPIFDVTAHDDPPELGMPTFSSAQESAPLQDRTHFS